MRYALQVKLGGMPLSRYRLEGVMINTEVATNRSTSIELHDLVGL